jgi:hypothetical protein
MSSPNGLEPAALVVRIAIAGHRKLTIPGLIRAQADSILETLDAPLASQPRHYIAVSQLAEGADRLITQAVLDRYRDGENPYVTATCHAILPAPPEEFFKSFEQGEASVREFLALVDPAPEIAAGYVDAARRMIDQCDLLIAVWDGEPERGPGGTASVVQWAREKHLPIFVIDANTGARRDELPCPKA